jgi:hypothetical protein
MSCKKFRAHNGAGRRELWLVRALEFKRPPDGQPPEPAAADLGTPAKTTFFAGRVDWLRASIPREFPAKDWHAGENHAFRRPHGLAEGPNSAKISAGNFRQSISSAVCRLRANTG